MPTRTIRTTARAPCHLPRRRCGRRTPGRRPAVLRPPDGEYFVAGNNEDFDGIDAFRRDDGTLADERRPRLLASTAVEIEGFRVAGLSGNHAPTRYETPRRALSGDRRHHFTHEDVDRAMALKDVDVFVAHEAPHGLIDTEDYDVGCERIDALLEELSPELWLVGHHHRHAESTFGDTRVVSVAPVWESYYTLDPGTFELARHGMPA